MKRINAILSFCLIILTVVSCKSTKEEGGFVINGNAEKLGVKEIQYSSFGSEKEPVTVEVKDGKFTITGKVDEPTQIGIMAGEGAYFMMYVENTNMQLELFKENRHGFDALAGKVTGCETQTHYKEVSDTESKFWDDLKKYEALLANKNEFAKLDKKEQERITKFVKHFRAGKDAISHNFIKAHPKAYYSAVLSRGLAGGRDSNGIKELIAALDPSLKNTKPVKEMLAMANTMVKDEVKLEDIFNVSNVAYKVDPAFKGAELKGINYLAHFSNNNICALNGAGEILTIDANGKKIKTIKPKLEGKITSIAVDKKDVIYAMTPIMKKVKKTYRGKTFERNELAGIECVRFDSNGKELGRVQLDGAKGATGARVVDNKIIVADYNQGILSVHDAQSGKQVNKIEGMRQCCGILDFSVNSKNEILTANLGAFRVEKFQLDGKREVAFGSRGRGVEQFHGCCNPVSVAGLSNGAIVTVEKDPTRIKIYSKTGASVIAGISEMVKGCQYIPMTVDSKDNLYLASPDKGMVKCVAN